MHLYKVLLLLLLGCCFVPDVYKALAHQWGKKKERLARCHDGHTVEGQSQTPNTSSPRMGRPARAHLLTWSRGIHGSEVLRWDLLLL